MSYMLCLFFFFSSRRRHTRFDCDWSSDVCSSDLELSRDRQRRPHSAAGRPQSHPHHRRDRVLSREARMTQGIDRREFLTRLGVTVGAASLGSPLAELPVAGPATAADEPGKGRISDKPVKFGHITILSGPGAVLGAPSLKGHTLAAEEINGAGGLLGKRKIETVTADEAAGPDAPVKEVKRMKLSEGIDYFSGVIAAHNQL